MNQNKKRNGVIFVVFLVIVSLVLTFGRWNPVGGILKSVFVPVGNFFSSLGVFFGSKFEFLFSIDEIKKENERLYYENLKLQGQKVTIEELKKENDDLRKELDLAPRSDYELEAALVIGRDLQLGNEIIHINKGSKSGIEVGMPVIVEKGIIVGVIKSVESNFSTVELLVGQETLIGAEVQETAAKGVVIGMYGTGVRLDKISQTESLSQGQSVITSGLGGSFPRGLLIGYVNQPGVSADGLFQNATISLPFDLEKLRLVWVIKGEK